MGIRKYIVTLTSEERERLTRLVSSGKDKAYRIKHANILLAADENGSNLTSQDIAKAFSCHLNTVSGICQRFVEQGLEASLDREAKLIALACRKPPEGSSHWALRLLADELVELGVVDSISYETVRRTLKKTSLNRTCEHVG